MQVMLLAYEAPEDFAVRRDKTKGEPYIAAWMAFGEKLREAGVHVRGAALAGPETATVISVRNGKRTVEDGPFADAKEQLGGLVVIEVPEMTAALDWAKQCPAAARGRVEARTIPDYGQGE